MTPIIPLSVMPAQAGIQTSSAWSPTFAGVTGRAA
jgi:hypothetical protein